MSAYSIPTPDVEAEVSTFVLNDTEVKLTGRTASRATNANQLGNVKNKTHELVEVMPANDDDGTWKKWVTRSVLFRIND